MNLGNRFAAALSRHPVPVEAVGEVAGELLEHFEHTRPDVVVCFASPHHTGAFDDISRSLHELLAPEAMIGCTAVGVAGGATEVEDGPGLAVFAASFGAGRVDAMTLEAETGDESMTIAGWPDAAPPRGTLLLLADPFTFPSTDFLGLVNARVPDLTVVGGLASAASAPGGNRLVIDGQVRTSGAVALLCSEDVPVRTVVSQGCRPIGEPFTITRASQNLIHELGGQPALARLQDIVQTATEDERELMRNGLHAGLVVDEHKLDFGRGDFLIRNVLGADSRSGAVAIGEYADVGTTLQFQVRDADAADEDLRELLAGVHGEGALLFTCNGRGSHLFPAPHHDAGTIAEMLGTVPLAGAFCAGEIGPVGGQNFLHGFTASIVVFER